MLNVQYGPDVNLEDLRGQLAGRLALALIISSIALIWISWPQETFPFFGVLPLAALLALGGVVHVLVGVRPALARHLLVWSLTAGLLVAMELFPAPWLPFLGLPLSFVGALLISGGGLAVAGMTGALATWLTYRGLRAYPFPELLMTLVLGMVFAWQTVRTLYTALEWAWTMQQRADDLLKLARDRQGELARALKTLDLTNTLLRRTQRELIIARRQADQARLMKEQFAANISHELRTPLNLILGFSEVMYLSSEVYGDMPWPPTLRQDVYQIYSSSRHLMEMIDDILDLSRFEMVGFTLNKETTELEPLLRGAAEIGENLFRGRPVRLEIDIPPDLPALEIDRTRIRQVVLNLLNNAARFTEQGMVRLEAKQADGEVVISVADTGPGIPSDHLQHIFDEFYQVDRSLHRKHGGAGLGLAISKRFVEAHDGRIWGESQQGVGSIFFFTLPIPEYHVPILHPYTTGTVEPSRSTQRPTVLVVDPDPAVADLIRRHMDEYDVVPVTHTDRLAETVMLHHPQAVVCNVPPGENIAVRGGCEVPVPFIECSLPSYGWMAKDLAVVACLTKPVTAQQLLGHIERLGSVHDVLVIDDDWGFCQLVERTLEAARRGFVVRHTYDGEDGLQAVRVRRPDLMLLDLVMPGMDGFQVLDEIRREPELAQVPVIVLTATSFVEDALKQRSTQVVMHRPDGLSPAEVLKCLRVMVSVLEPHYDERFVPNGLLIG